MTEGAMGTGRNGGELWVSGAQHVTEPGFTAVLFFTDRV